MGFRNENKIWSVKLQEALTVSIGIFINTFKPFVINKFVLLMLLAANFILYNDEADKKYSLSFLNSDSASDILKNY